MFTRNAQLAVLLLSAALASCSQQDDAISGIGADGEEITTTISVKAPDMFGSRAVPDIYQPDYNFDGETDIHAPSVTQYLGTSGMPSIGNVDLGNEGDPYNGHPLTYTVAIYTQKVAAEGETDPTYTLVDWQSQVNVHASEAYFNFRLIKGQTYRIVAYADFSGESKDNLTDITVAPTEALNDELADAFFVSQDFVADEFLGAVLKRPFAKLRLIAHDLDRFAIEEKYKITKVEVKYTNQPMLAVTKFNALTGEFNYDDGAEAEHIVKARPVSYAQEYEDDKTVKKIKDETGEIIGNVGAAVFTMYLPANFGTPTDADLTHGTPINDEVEIPQSWMYPFDVTVSYVNEKGEEHKIERSYQFDIPVKRNWLTTVDVTNFWSDNTGVTVSVNPEFEGFIDYVPNNTYVVTDEESLNAAVKAIEESKEKKGKIVLGNDIATNYGIRIGYWEKTNPVTLSPNESVTIHLDLAGYALTALNNPERASISTIALYGPSTLIVDDTSKDGTGVVENKSGQAIITWRYGGNIIINGGSFKSNGNAGAIYLGDTYKYVGFDQLGAPRSTLTINGGWFENCSNLPVANSVLLNLYNGGWPEGAHPDDQGFGQVNVRGGSYVDFDPRNGDNITGTMTNEWVDSNKYNVLTSTVNGRTVYTVVHKDYDGKTPETWNNTESLEK